MVKSVYEFPGPARITGEDVRRYLKLDQVVDEPSAERWRQERKVRDIQYEIDDLDMVDSGEERTENETILNAVLEASKTSAAVLDAILKMLSDVQGRMRAVEESDHCGGGAE